MNKINYVFIILVITLELLGIVVILNMPNAETDFQISTIDPLPEKEEIKKEPVSGTITFNTSVSSELQQELTAFLTNFFDKYYRIMQNLQMEDLSEEFISLEDAYIYKTALELLIENRIQKDFDLSLTKASYELKVQKVTNTNDDIKITVLENNKLNFTFIPQYESKVYNVENNFVLTKVDGVYKISKYEKVQDFFVMITDVYKRTSDYQKALDQIKLDYLEKFAVQNAKIAKMQEDYLNGIHEPLSCDHEFNRTAAYEYAIKWVGKRNSEWKTYSANCVNYVSQVMYAGGIPMDHIGSQQWKHYSNKRNTNNVPDGFVYSWTYVPSIVDYFKKNTGYGLCGKYDDNIYYGEAGDVIVVGTKGPTRHVISVIGQIKNEKGEVIDLLVNSNTVDLEYFPLSAYAYPYKILMKVYGWNN
ncbi:MAG: amidase domain-containing protein [Bacilli bacterium]|nr:amidase domain-containing protein [Bacilli bacterium]